jgi:hypothetical protein
VQSTIWDEAVTIAGADPDFHRRDMFDAIAAGSFAEWDFAVQRLTQEEADTFPFDHLDATKLIPEELVPLKVIGRMVLDRWPDDFFAGTEQVACCGPVQGPAGRVSPARRARQISKSTGCGRSLTTVPPQDMRQAFGSTSQSPTVNEARRGTSGGAPEAIRVPRSGAPAPQGRLRQESPRGPHRLRAGPAAPRIIRGETEGLCGHQSRVPSRSIPGLYGVVVCAVRRRAREFTPARATFRRGPRLIS